MISGADAASKLNYTYSIREKVLSDYRLTHLVGSNLMLTYFQVQQLLQLVVGCSCTLYCSYLLPSQDGQNSQIEVNRGFSLVFTNDMGHPVVLYGMKCLCTH